MLTLAYTLVLSSARLFHSCLTLCDTMDCNPPGSSVLGILQARILEWVTMPPPGDLSDPGMLSMSLMSPTLAGQLEAHITI